MPGLAPERHASASYDEPSLRFAIVDYVVLQGHSNETIFSLAQMFSPSPRSDAVERHIRDLVGEGLLMIDGCKVKAGPAWTTELLAP